MFSDKSDLYRYSLVLAPLLIALPGMRFDYPFFAWVMFVPLLLLMRETQTKKGWLLIFVLLQLGVFFQIFKMYSDPIPFLLIPLFSVPAAFGSFVLLVLFELARRRLDERIGIFVFASFMVVGEYLGYATSDFGTWGVAAYTQLDWLELMQFASLFGITFISFFIFLSNAFVASMLSTKRLYIKTMLLSFGVFLAFYTYGVIRADAVIDAKQINVAAITSDLVIAPDRIPAREALEANTRTLFERTITAGERGAKIIAWNEGATIIGKMEEAAFLDRAKKVAIQADAAVFYAYIVPLEGIKRFENKFVLITHTGEVLDRYFKRRPVPGEGAVKGDTPLTSYPLYGATVGGGICFDYDFIDIGLENAHHQVGLVVVPSSDWRGIDDYHAKMAMVRGIEGGYSLLRPVRGATSIASDPHGKIRASMSYFENTEKIMLASLPYEPVDTLYEQIGDLFVYLNILFLAGVLLFGFYNGRREGQSPSRLR